MDETAACGGDILGVSGRMKMKQKSERVEFSGRVDVSREGDVIKVQKLLSMWKFQSGGDGHGGRVD